MADEVLDVKGLDDDMGGTDDLTLTSQDNVSITVKRKVALGSELIKTMTDNGKERFDSLRVGNVFAV